MARVDALDAHHVCVTGGEPLAQPNAAPLISRLCDAGYNVSVETAGALDITRVDTRASRIVDIKTPGSGEVQRNLWSNIDALTAHDQLKFVLCSRDDYDWACRQLESICLPDNCLVWFSPSHGEINATELADWIVADRMNVRMQLQLHKQLWADEPGR